VRRQLTTHTGESRRFLRAWGIALAAGLALAIGAAQPEKPAPEKPTPQPENPAPAQPEKPPAVEPPPQETTGEAEEREAIVTLRDGQRYTGILISRDEKTIVLRIAGIATPIKAGQIDHVQILPPINERYQQMRSAIDDKDVEGILRLVEWLRSKSQWDSALTEVDHVLALQPDNPDAARLKLLVQSQKELAAKAHAGKTPPPPKAKKDVVPAPGATGPTFPLLTESDINVIKVYEVDLSDPPRMLIDHDTIKTLIEQHIGDPLIPTTQQGRDALYRDPPAKILDIMFKVQARNLYDRVKVIDQPRPMKIFRDKVHRTWLINSCATTRCHGGPDAGRLMLATERPGSDATVYTNFLILDRYRTRDGKPLINYDDPAHSPLLQVALPKERSTFKHPEVAGEQGRGDLYRPIFKNEDDPRFQDALDWIKAMYRPRPEYPIQYSPPGPQGISPRDPKEPPIPR
jgi:hypothetical protein